MIFSRHGNNYSKPSSRDPSNPVCIIMDMDSSIIARGEILEGGVSGRNMQITITDSHAGAVVDAELVQIVPADTDTPPSLGRVILRRGNHIVIDPLRTLDSGVRQNLRMPISFETFIYPLSGGRAPAVSENLSCGGIAFYTDWQLKPHELFEIVIPITSSGPLIVTGEILRIADTQQEKLYASKFCNLCLDEEAKLREAVFQVQLGNKISTARKYPKSAL